MIEALKAVKQALAYAKFEDPAIKSGVNNLVDELDTELSGENYEPGTAVEESAALLVSALDSTDSKKEEAAGADEDIDDDPFAGLGDEDEE
jgi:hypothetical protein